MAPHSSDWPSLASLCPTWDSRPGLARQACLAPFRQGDIHISGTKYQRAKVMPIYQEFYGFIKLDKQEKDHIFQECTEITWDSYCKTSKRIVEGLL